MAEFQKFNYRGTNPWPKFIEFLTLSGYRVDIEGGAWPVKATHTLTGDVIFAKKASERMSAYDLATILDSNGEKRVVLADYKGKPDEWLRIWVAFAHESNIGVYDLHSGWVNMPGTVDVSKLQSFYSRLPSIPKMDEDGNPTKACTKCGEYKRLTEFYKKPRSRAGSVDPYRSICKACFK